MKILISISNRKHAYLDALLYTNSEVRNLPVTVIVGDRHGSVRLLLSQRHEGLAEKYSFFEARFGENANKGKTGFLVRGSIKVSRLHEKHQGASKRGTMFGAE